MMKSFSTAPLLFLAALFACLPSIADAECVDGHDNCPFWAEKGECARNPVWMHENCSKSCNACKDHSEMYDPECKDSHENCAFWQSKGECENNKKWMSENCAMSCKTCTPDASFSKRALGKGADLGVPQKIYHHEDGTMREDIQFIISKARNYVQVLVKNEEDKLACKNLHEECAYWAFRGECENNKSWMAENCAPICQACHKPIEV